MVMVVVSQGAELFKVDLLGPGAVCQGEHVLNPFGETGGVGRGRDATVPYLVRKKKQQRRPFKNQNSCVTLSVESRP